MKVTKHEHACLVLTKRDESLVIDPGTFTLPLTDVEGVVAVVITHEHPDHWTAEQLERIRDRNPDARILAPAAVAALAGTIPIETVAPGDTIEVGSFTLSFVGGEHAEIHQSIPRVANVGVIVDDELYHPGDALHVPDAQIEVLAIPTSGPWLKTGEAMDFLERVAPKRAFPIHDAINSVIGKGSVNGRLESYGNQFGVEWFVLGDGESTDL